MNPILCNILLISIVLFSILFGYLLGREREKKGSFRKIFSEK